MQFTREQKAEAFDNIPKDLKAVVMSTTLENIFLEIGKQGQLSLDKAGVLSELIIVTILGLLPREELQNNIQKELGLSSIQASTLTKTVNENVFLKIREILQKEEENENVKPEEAAPQAAEPTNDYPDITKEDLLAEIENPTPTIHPISIVDQTIPGPARPMEIMATPVATKDSVASEFIAGKMTETVSLPSQKVNITEPQPKEKPKSYAADPYREPIS